MYVNTGAAKVSRSQKDHFSDYILEDNALKKVPRHALGSVQSIRGEWRSLSPIIHFQNDKIPEPIDNIHTFQIQFPTPGVINWVPTSDNDYLVLPRIRDFSFRVIHDTVAVPIPGTTSKCPELRTKSMALWASTESVKDYQDANPNINVVDVKDLQMKYQPKGLLHYRLKGQRISVSDNQDTSLATVKTSDTPNVLYDQLIRLSKTRPKDTSNTHTYTFNMDYEPTPNVVTPITWDRETGQCYGDSCYVHMWLENGVWDQDSVIYFHVKWSLEKVTAKDMWYYQNALETRKKLIASGAFLKQEIDALKEKQQIFYTVVDQAPGTALTDTSKAKYFAWKSYIEEGRFVQHLNPGVLESSKDEDTTPGLHWSLLDPNHPDYVQRDASGNPLAMKIAQETNPIVLEPQTNFEEGTAVARGALLEADDEDPEKLEVHDETTK